MYTICTNDWEIIAQNVSRSELLRLRGLDEDGYRIPGKQKLIRLYPKRDNLWISEVDGSIILAELRRDIQQTPPFAEANTTSRRQSYVAANGNSGWYFELNVERCFNYTTYDQSAMEMLHIALRTQIGEFVAGADVDKFSQWIREIDKATQGRKAPIRQQIRNIQNDLQAYGAERLTMEQLKHKLSVGAKTSLLQAA